MIFTKKGIYVDIVSGEPLFSSAEKYDVRLWLAIIQQTNSEKTNYAKSRFSHGMHRIEVRSKEANSHLGHVFTDGPVDKGVRVTAHQFCLHSKIHSH